MSDEEGDGIDGEEELAPPDWRVRAGPTQKKREEHEARHVPSRGWCTYCRMGRGRTHHHVTEQKKGESVEKTHHCDGPLLDETEVCCECSIELEESVTCIAVKEDRHQHIMSSVALKRESKNRGQLIERGSPFIDLLGYRDITPKTDMGPAIIAFRSRGADMCKAVQKSPQKTQ